MRFGPIAAALSLAVLVGCGTTGSAPPAAVITAHMSRPVETGPTQMLGPPKAKLYTYVLAHRNASEQANKALNRLLRETQTAPAPIEQQPPGISLENLNLFLLPAKAGRREPYFVLGDEYSFDLSELYLVYFGDVLGKPYPDMALRLNRAGPFLIATDGQLPEIAAKRRDITVLLLDLTNQDEAVIPIHMMAFKKAASNLPAGPTTLEDWKAHLASFMIRLNEAIPAIPKAVAQFVKAVEIPGAAAGEPPRPTAGGGSPQ